MKEKIKSILIFTYFPLLLIFLVVSYFLRDLYLFSMRYEIILFLLLLPVFYKRMRIASTPFILLGSFLFPFSYLSDYFKIDELALHLGAISLLNFLVASLIILINYYKDSRLKSETKDVKKVLFIANAIVGEVPGVSGGESRFIEIGKVWKDLGYEVHLMSGKGGKVLCKKLGLDVILHTLTSSTRDTRLEFIIRTFKEIFYIPKLLNDFDEGVVYSTSEQVYDVLPGMFLKMFYGNRIRFGVAVHWLPPILFWKRSGSTLINSFLFMVSERLGLILAWFSADAMFPVSESTYMDMKKAGLYNQKTHIVKCGVNLEELRQISKKYKTKRYEATFMKRIQSVKGIFDLIDIWEIVVRSKPDALLNIIGSGIDEDKAKEYMKKKKLEKNIKFLGAIYDYEEKFSIISRSKLFLLPSLEENWAIVIGEAMACGVPVICYDLKELRKVWEDSVTFIDFRNIKQFAEKTLNLLENPKEYVSLVKAGNKYIKRYDWKSIAEDELHSLVY